MKTMGSGKTFAAAALALGAGGVAHAGFLDNVNYSFGGFVRAEVATRTTSLENPNNQNGNTFNNVDAERQAFLPPKLAVNAIRWGAIPLGVDISGLPVIGQVIPAVGFSDTIRRSDFVATHDNNFNYTVLRAEGELGIRFGRKFRIIGRLRALYHPDDVIDGFDATSVDAFQGGIIGGDPRLYHGNTPNYFEYIVDGGKEPLPLEWAGSNYQVYFPALLAEYTGGGLTIRVGNQQIAWGQSIFFRVFDVPNGIDLRRHLILDRALEEFSDKRTPQLSARVTYQLTNEILVDAYAAQFTPTIFGNPNTPYNVIPAQFTVYDQYDKGGYSDEINYGIRLKGDYGQWGWQAAAVRRYGPEGTFAWTKTGVNKPLFGPLGNLVNTAYNIRPACPAGTQGYQLLCRNFADSGEALANAPFIAEPGGVYSASEWFDYAAQVRLDGIHGLNAAIENFDGAQDIFASPVETYKEAFAQLNTFFIGSGGSLRGFISRDYHVENVFMLGGSYVIDSDNDFLNQLIMNLEVQYTPERHFTNISLSPQRIVQDEYTVSLVMDKWHRFFDEFPGTYIVFQALTKNRSDLVGRHLSGYGGRAVLEDDATRQTDPLSGNATYLVAGFLQPFPNKIWEIEFATLLDPQGGIFAQPGVRWNPGKGVTVEGFYNYINGELWGNPYDNLVSTLDFAEEFTLRVTYQF